MTRPLHTVGLHPTDGHEPALAPATGRDRKGQWWLAAVAGAFVLAQLTVVRPGMGLGWDESVYVSQVSSHAPASFFSAPRARGISLLVAPVAGWSSSTPLLRVYLALLSGLGLFVALRVWRGLFPVRVLTLGGALFASLWVTVFYGPQAMPNYWVAVGALTGVGCFLQAQTDRTRRGPVWGLAASALLMAWMRPTDAVWVALPLLFALVVLRQWRHARLLIALAGGLVAGAAEWVIEAYVRFGGLSQRLSEGSDIQGGLGWHIAIGDQLRSLSGRSLCRPCTGAMPNPVVTAWWFALPVLAAIGLAVAVRGRRTPSTALPLACAVTAAIPYLFLIGYAAPRFLLPTYALLAIPVADALVWLVTAPGRAWRPVAVTLVAVGLAGHLAVQYAVLAHTVRRTTADHETWERTSAALRRLGLRPPCLLTGPSTIPIAFSAGCASASTDGPNANTDATGIAQAAQRMPVAVLTTGATRPPSYARGWRLVRLDGAVYAYIAPTALRDRVT
ncbi:hypothetical protein OH768_35525 [Streptomyces sp. NBC_01622]|uniref:hypothetical protein n=1 Tax=Streptomyces sp. NBC_01622 TaxID=2975903 RepID=UPI0038641D04|nr:hypothetical protein OH768_35525 [Streptomyces sp. NBC_01622]